jgi:TPR repeat protein
MEQKAPPPAAADQFGMAPPAPEAQQPSAAAGLSLAEGDMSFRDGEVSTARFYFERALDAGEAEAAERMAETFDPAFLTQGRLRSVHGDITAARFWYRRAIDLGVAEGQARLQYLDREAAAAGTAGQERGNRFGGQAAAPPDDGRADSGEMTFHQLLERILHPPRGG